MSTNAYPTKAADVPHSPYVGKDDVFFLFEVSQENGGYHLNAAPDAPIAINRKELRDEIAAQTGVFLPLRTEVSKKNIPDEVKESWSRIDWDKMYTGATGAIPHVQVADEAQTRILLMQNSMDKPVNPGRWNFPSGLISSRHPVETAFLELNEESGLLIPTDTHLVGLNFHLPRELPALSDEFQKATFGGRAKQEANIRAQLEKHYPEHKDKPIVWVPVHTKLMNEGVCDAVTIDVLTQRFKTVAHVVKDDKAMSVNIHYPIKAVEGVNLIAVDPEKFGRNAKLMTLPEAHEADTIPAPRDYISRVAGAAAKKLVM